MSKVRFDNNKLRGRIYEICGTVDDFASKVGIASPTISSRLKGSTDWKASEIYKAAEVLKIHTEDYGVYFFTPSVAKAQQEA